MNKSLGEAPLFGVKKTSMTKTSSPKDSVSINFKTNGDFKGVIDKYCFDNKITQKKLFEEGAKLYMSKH